MSDNPGQSNSLGAVLRRAREALGHTLRAVERETGISNAYLSQLETGKIEKPSPNFLFKLAGFYSLSYDQLMEMAGYISKREITPSTPRSLSGVALAAVEDLTPEEQGMLMDYIGYLRSRRKKE
jgi:transcriptional regulator with XRE-family HTH domain